MFIYRCNFNIYINKYYGAYNTIIIITNLAIYLKLLNIINEFVHNHFL
jgi:hypothetical protein